MKPSQDLPKLYTGKDAETIEEMAEESGLSESSIRLHAKKMEKSGIWKKVLIKKGRGTLSAYIKVK